jgi:tyrosinase
MQTFINGIQNNSEAAKNLQGANWYQSGKEVFTVGEAVYRLLSKEYFSTYKLFVTTRYSPEDTGNARDYMSLEGIHKYGF